MSTWRAASFAFDCARSQGFARLGGGRVAFFTPGILPYAPSEPASPFAPILRRSACSKKGNPKKRHPGTARRLLRRRRALAASCRSELARDQTLAHRETKPATDRSHRDQGRSCIVVSEPARRVSPQGRGHGCPRASRRHRMCLRKTSVPPHAPERRSLPGGPPGCPFPWFLSLGQARERNSAAAGAVETPRSRTIRNE